MKLKNFIPGNTFELFGSQKTNGAKIGNKNGKSKQPRTGVGGRSLGVAGEISGSKYMDKLVGQTKS